MKYSLSGKVFGLGIFLIVNTFAVLTPDAKHLYTFATQGKDISDRLLLFTLNETTNTYQYTKFIIKDAPYFGVLYMTVSPDGKNLYFAATGGFVIYARDASSGDLTRIRDINHAGAFAESAPDRLILTQGRIRN